MVAILVLPYWSLYAQPRFDFYGNMVVLPVLSSADEQGLVNGTVPDPVKKMLLTGQESFHLGDWSTVLFLKKYVAAQLPAKTKNEQAKALSALLSLAGLNHATASRKDGTQQVLVNVGGTFYYSALTLKQDGMRLIAPEVRLDEDVQDITPVLMKGKNICLDAPAPELSGSDYRRKTCTFFNIATDAEDSIEFRYSPRYINFSHDFPMSIRGDGYKNYPVSAGFKSSLFQALDKKIAVCKNKTDSMRFVLRFAQSAIESGDNEDMFGYAGYPSYPEHTLSLAEGDCDDKCCLYVFLLKKYFPAQAVVMLYYKEHLQVGVADTMFDGATEGYVLYKGRKYMVAETMDSVGELGTVFNTLGQPLAIYEE
ncbi:hypothetical protein HNQ91_002070 [Filimonas zeae]|nr:hypothetical protein [Filimonas zeae]MDR6339019.1 hypothetical protein [Filimonas zeae]